MATDPSIILQGALPPPQPITLNSIAQITQMQQQALQMKRDRAIQNSLAAIYANPSNLGPDGMPNAQAIQQIGRISPQAAQALTTQRAAVDEKMAITSKDQMEAGQIAQKNIQESVRDPALNAYDQALASGKTPQQAQQIAQKVYSDGIDTLFSSGYIPDSMKARVPQNFDPVRVRANSLSYKDQQDLQIKRNQQQGLEDYRASELGLGKARLGLEAERTGLEADRLRREKDAEEVGGQLSPEAIKDAAGRYNLDGTLPPLGMGKQGLSVRNAILNAAAEMARGKSPTDQRIEQITGKAAGQARAQLEKNVNNIELAEKTALGSADMVEKASENYARSGAPMANRTLNYYRANISGDPAYQKLNNDITTFKNEYVKVMTGAGQATDSARAEADHLVNIDMGHDQLMAGIGEMKKEMQSVRENAIKEARQSSSAQTRNPETGEAKTLIYDPATGTFK